MPDPLSFRVIHIIDSFCNFVSRGHADIHGLTFVPNVINVEGNGVHSSNQFLYGIIFLKS